ncbi:MAG: 23S rRNA (adenine(2503)-C(2))-methyltransferase RlmN [Candidatus Nealsonbacteria bacterium]|nr:23S rRNA (adenine(2503)-C(2))-methyltransferase RlmN [Candidatus Nealsonbacteria bacterium]
MDLVNLDKILEKEPKYRLKQAKSAVFKDLIEDWQEAKTLPQGLRKELQEHCPLRLEASIFGTPDGPSRALFSLRGGLKVESVLLRHKDGRNTVCVSSQVGCVLCCQFCATGQLGFKRNLDYPEITDQVLFFARLLKKEKQKITNVVFMGMGEPFLNYDNVLKTIEILNDKDGFNLGSRHFSISTVGIVEGIKKLAEENFQVNLAVSLHAPDDKLREKIMPINKKYPLEKILDAVNDYVKKTKRRVMFEYIMIKDVNDSDEQATKLAELLKNIPLSFVNLISYNPTGIFRPSLPERIKRFKEVLEEKGISVTQRYRFGQDIAAACGQLAGKR